MRVPESSSGSVWTVAWKSSSPENSTMRRRLVDGHLLLESLGCIKYEAKQEAWQIVPDVRLRYGAWP